MKHAKRLALLIFGSMLTASAFACGVCIEDKVAATFDYGVVMSATAKRHVVVFGEVEGVVDMRALSAKIAREAPRMRGVELGTVRTSSSPAAFSFALDPTAATADAAVGELQRRLHTRGAKLSVLRVVTAESLLPLAKKGPSN